MEHLINFRDGIITYENLFWLFKNAPHKAIDQLQFEEDLLQVSFFDEKYILGDLCKKPFPRQPKPQHRFSAVFVSNIHRFYPNTPLILPGYPIIRHPGRLLGGNRHT